ncbi:profilin-A [Microthyrium microscopicum]|uniref:Profilin n=1 Tax=Microthyrium microscopicum TaxID=703497 RepID=A0A6A6UP57_9PEZI|nr:profilin-A [Microthyrium microscopicum]
MSWQAYIDSSLVGTGYIDSAAIFSVDGKDDWAHATNFKISPEEMQVIVGSFTKSSDVLAGGFKVNAVKYMAISTPDSETNPGVLMGRSGKEGFVVAKTTQALILAHHPETVMTPQCVDVVEKLAKYLKDLGY